jgi:hypothetical protein
MAGPATWTKSAWRDAGQLLVVVDPDAVDPRANGRPLDEWFAQLRNDGKLAEAVQFVAHALPRYECVVWAAQSLLETDAIDRQDPLAKAVLRWIDDPYDSKRREAMQLAEQPAANDAVRFLANAVAFSGGSLAPEDMPAVQPAPDVCAKLAAAAVLTGAYALDDPEAVLRRSLDLGETTARSG